MSNERDIAEDKRQQQAAKDLLEFSTNRGWGGVRERAGKPTQFEKPMKRKEVMLPDEAIEFFLALGNGNFSAGVRQAWRSLTKRAADASPESPLKNKRQVAKRR